MKHCVTLVLVLVLSIAESANILGLGLVASYSHQVVYQPIWEELSKRGHQVTVITPNPINNPELINLTEIDTSFLYKFTATSRIDLILSKSATSREKMRGICQVTSVVAESVLNYTKVQDLLNEDHHFDVVMMEYYSPVFYALGHKYQAPVIGLSSMGSFISTHDAVGNPSHPVVFPLFDIAVSNGQLSFGQRIDSAFHAIWYRYFHYYEYLPRCQEIAMKYIGKDIPYIGDLEKNISMYFLNENFLIYPPRPSVPTVIQLEQMHIKPVKPLAKDLQELLDEATEGVIYFSLGSNVHSVNISPKLRSTIIEALGELPYRVLWKWESDNLPGKPSNVITRKWLPQQDILGHKNIKAFVSQGGLQSVEEAISRGVPLMLMPFMVDQPKNAQRVVELGIGVQVDPETVTKEELKNSIIEVARNQKYRQKIKEIRDLLDDQPMTGLEKAVWWTEYVIRHKGTRHLRSPMADISWHQFLLLDVLAVTLVLPLVIIYLFLKLSVKFFAKHKK